MIAIITIVFILEILGQSGYSQSNKFTLKTYIKNFIELNNSCDTSLFYKHLAEWLGKNTAKIIVSQKWKDKKSYVNTNQKSDEINKKIINGFSEIETINNYLEIRLSDSLDITDVIKNFDYIYYYTGAYYSKWDATRAIIPVGELGLKHNFGYATTTNGKRYWSSGKGHSPDLLIRGPNYFQETKYRRKTFPFILDNEVQTYEVKFNMKLGEKLQSPQLDDEVCKIMVYVKYDSCRIKKRVLESKILKVRDFENSMNLKLRYNYSDFIQNAFTSAFDQKINTTISGNTNKRLIDVEFRVQYLNPNYELLVESIEVYDVDIWLRRLKDKMLRNIARKNIADYTNRLKIKYSQFNKDILKYLIISDEPQSNDSNIPYSFVKSVLDSLNNAWAEGAPQLFTHFFPQRNRQQNEAVIIPPYAKTVKPKPFHFYYAPFFYKEKF